MRIRRIASDWMVELELRGEGRWCADVFIAAHGDHLGRRASLDLDAFLDGV